MTVAPFRHQYANPQLPLCWRVVPFDVVVPKPDVRLPERLELELPGVLAWLVEGHRRYAESGLELPEAVTAATDRYRASSDVLGRFLDECTVTGPAEAVYVRA